ncbi:MAG TPA: beta-propeller domain-containing protein, partial [Sphingomicrobium sp.]|nr:beta-propeller domain-containing protein [Sphingomicrobium sp.]
MANPRYGSLGRLAAITLIVAGGITALACSSENQAVAQQGQPASVRAGGQLASFESDADYLAFLKKRRDSAQRRRLELPGISGADVAYSPAPAPPAAANETSAMKVGVAQASDRITNTQEADVDEGSIVKKRGDLLVILRRGRLFTVSIAGGQMRPIDHINAFPPGITGGGDWYDEMLISGDRVIVIGYSYARGGTEVNRFRLSPDGRLRFEDAYHLRSNDYYSSRNYASRLIGNRLVYYTPLYLGWGNDPFAGFPAVSRWEKDRKPVFRRVARAR